MKKQPSIILSTLLLSSTLCSCGDTTTTTQPTNDNIGISENSSEIDTEIQTETQAETKTEAQTEEKQIIDEDPNLTFNEQSVLGDWTITVTGMKIADVIKQNEYFGFTPNEGNKYIQVFVTITNNGKTSNSFLNYSDYISTRLYFGDGYEFSSTNLIGYDKDLHYSLLNPLSSASGEIAFEVPDSVATSTDELIFSLILDDDRVNYKIR